jgi:hypothetical protein
MRRTARFTVVMVRMRVTGRMGCWMSASLSAAASVSAAATAVSAAATAVGEGRQG